MNELDAFITDATTRYPAISEITLFGSQSRGAARPDSHWDIVVCFPADKNKDWVDPGFPTPPNYRPPWPEQIELDFVNDPVFARHFETFLDLFVLCIDGKWIYPGWPEPRGFFPNDSPY